MIKRMLMMASVGALATLILSTSCASIVSRSYYNVTINSVPSEVKVRVLNRKGGEVAAGQTPVTLRLKASEGFFKSAKYTLEFSKEGYEGKQMPLEASIEPWYFGNLLFGGFIGLLIVDPATGAMWKIEDTSISTSLEPKARPIAVAKEEGGKKELNVYALSDVPVELRKHMVAVQVK